MTADEAQGELFPAHPPAPTAPAPPSTRLPRHVLEHLDALGLLNHDGIGRTITPGRCPRCNAPTLRGLDGPVAAVTAIADDVEVDALGEALAVATKRMRWWVGTFPDGKRGSTWQFVPRDLEHIGKPFRGPVYIEHRCNAPPPPTTQSLWPKQRSSVDYPDEPPF